jgi:hypothetical protein
MSKLAIVATTLLAVFSGGQTVFAEEAIPAPRCVCGLSTGGDIWSAGHPISSDSTNPSEKERESMGHAPTPETLPRHDRRSSAADTNQPLRWLSRAHTMELTDIPHGSKFT